LIEAFQVAAIHTLLLGHAWAKRTGRQRPGGLVPRGAFVGWPVTRTDVMEPTRMADFRNDTTDHTDKRDKRNARRRAGFAHGEKFICEVGGERLHHGDPCLVERGERTRGSAQRFWVL
jgi:hypothetical protein